MEKVEDSIQQSASLKSDDKDFLQFIATEGWEYLSPCGCRSQMDKYINKNEKYKNYEIWINKGKTIFEIRVKSERISLKVASGSALYYLNVYYNNLPK